jgi:superfamily II DNA/RNA helicase
MPTITRDELASRYLDQLPYTPYKVQEDALLAWFSNDQGVLVCAPTGTGKTVIAEAALFEALHTGTKAYYTTPLIALTEQKFREMQHRAVDWGFHPNDVGLVTGNRRENPDAPILVVVAEILLNRLLHAEFDFSTASAVVMDEFHSFNDPERGIVWELTLGMLPPHVRTLLLSATVGNAMDFIHWLRLSHKRTLELVVGEERKVPLEYHWVGDELLSEQLELMAEGDSETRMLPALVFCFNRDECWSVAEQIKGKQVLASGQQSLLVEALAQHDWSQGAGTKLRQLLLRGVGVHHAGLLPKYRRIVEDLFQHRLLSVAICTETLAAGINLPARSVVLPSILKGPPGKKRLIEPSAAHQIFGRAGRPQFDTQGHAYVLAHEDDVRIARWKEQYNQIPENTKDPGLLKAKKALKKKMPHRRDNEQYWNEAQFQKLVAAPPGKLFSRGPIPWRLLAYMLDASPEIEKVRQLVNKRLMDATHLQAAQADLDRMLVVLHRGGYVRLEPPPPEMVAIAKVTEGEAASGDGAVAPEETAKSKPVLNMMFSEPVKAPAKEAAAKPDLPAYKPTFAYPCAGLKDLSLFRGVHPLYAQFLLKHLGIADRRERIQAFESILDFPPPVARYVRVPKQHDMPPGPLATERLDQQLLQHGLATVDELTERSQEDEEPWKPRRSYDAEQDEEPKWVLTIAEKLRRLFDFEVPDVTDLRTRAVWAAGELLMDYGGNFNKFISGKDLAKQEGIIFRHLLRMILLIEEFRSFVPAEIDAAAWRFELDEVSAQLTKCCRDVDPECTDKVLEKKDEPEEPEQFGAGIFD